MQQTDFLPTVFLMGPTAAGKTAVALDLAHALPVDVISVDSAMVYRGMDVGTGKPDLETLSRVPHALVDIREPETAYSAAEFSEDASAAIASARHRGRLPLLVGGTGLYFRALRQGLSALPSGDAKLRARIESEAEEIGWPALHHRLLARDPEAAARIHPNDAQRIQRALEVWEITGRSMSSAWEETVSPQLDGPLITLILAPRIRAELHQRIASRFQEMLRRGFVEEVERLRKRPRLQRTMPAMRAVGYRQIWDHLEGVTSREDMLERAIAATRQLAKRQLTWLREEPDAVWFDALDQGVSQQVLGYLQAALP
ncbi:MAG: tRNA (adenosine(37)-N6)-dimethylallyltransferase MiaA [Gammaproteobacteria bacterium]|nr:MAG: tRNA (adenosine(37)-N6)-dimethylallyltransferase MiaA [Gammaproteobacteria bacterium]